jgi:hypothetical protein
MTKLLIIPCPDAAISRQLVDKIYEKRKAAALDLEKSVRPAHVPRTPANSLSDRYENASSKESTSE